MLDALLFWLDELLNTYDDVYVVSMSQVLAWMQWPTTAALAVNFAPWKTKCTSLDTPDRCQVSGANWKCVLCNLCVIFYRNLTIVSLAPRVCCQSRDYRLVTSVPDSIPGSEIPRELIRRLETRR